jgi:16S rRNA (adenine1518-N6/adenine1519-N6)-dimethyltransferase
MAEKPNTPNSELPRQTLTYVRGLLQAHGLMPKAKMGQNFLIDLNLMDVILEAAELSVEDSVLEVGSGTGSLTSRLADRAGMVTSVELDPDFHELVKDLFHKRKNVELIHADILARKNELNPNVLEAWNRKTIEKGCTRLKLVANLPYVVATPVIANLLLTEIPVERMVVMVQLEVAERLAANIGVKDYSSLSILVQSLARVKIIRRLGPQVFWPAPEVDSAIVQIIPDAEMRAKVPNPVAFRSFLRDLYTHRRKNLRASLSGWPSGRKDKKAIDTMLESLDIDGGIRAESLDIPTHLRLAAAFQKLEAEESA